MDFARNAVINCRNAMEAGFVSERHVRDVIKSKNAKIETLLKFLNSDNEAIKTAMIRIVSAFNCTGLLVELALKEINRANLFQILNIISKNTEDVKLLGQLLTSSDIMIRDATIDMFRRVGNVDLLFPLVFDKDDNLVERIKRYLDETGKPGYRKPN